MLSLSLGIISDVELILESKGAEKMKMNSAVIVIPLILIVAFVLFFTVIDFSGGKEKEHAETETVSEGTSEQAETEGTAEEGTTENAETEGTTEGTENAAAVDTEAIYQKNCISCHGNQYQGGVGPQLTGISSKYEKADIENILINGKGAMPGGLVSAEEASAMAEWLLTLK